MSNSIYPKFKVLLFPFLLIIGCVLFMFAVPAADYLNSKKPVTASVVNYADSNTAANNNRFAVLYEQMKLDSLGLSHEAFTYALQGYMSLVANGDVKRDNLLSIVDFSLPSSKKRLFVI